MQLSCHLVHQRAIDPIFRRVCNPPMAQTEREAYLKNLEGLVTARTEQLRTMVALAEEFIQLAEKAKRILADGSKPVE